MAELALRPPPTPVLLSSKVTKGIIIEACLDADWEALHEDDPHALIAAYDELGTQVAYVRWLMSGELTEAWVVLRTQKALWKERDKVAEQIGMELISLDDDQPRPRREVEKRIKRLRKQAKRLRKAQRECSRFWKECMEYDKDQEAAARLGLGGGGEG